MLKKEVSISENMDEGKEDCREASKSMMEITHLKLTVWNEIKAPSCAVANDRLLFPKFLITSGVAFVMHRLIQQSSRWQ